VTAHNGDTVVAATTSPKVAIKALTQPLPQERSKRKYMLRQIQNTISKVLDLRKGLILVGLVSILVGGFVIGGGVNVGAVEVPKSEFKTLTGYGANTLLDFTGTNTNKEGLAFSDINDLKISSSPLAIKCKNEKIASSTNTGVKTTECIVTNTREYFLSKNCVFDGVDKLQCNDFEKVTFSADGTSNVDAGTVATINSQAKATTETDSGFQKDKDTILQYSAKDFAVVQSDGTSKDIKGGNEAGKGECGINQAGILCRVTKSAGVFENYICKQSADQSATGQGKIECNNKLAITTEIKKLSEVPNLSTAISTNNLAPAKKQPDGDLLGGLFTLIYKIVAAIIMALLFLVRYLQMTVLLLFISVMTVLLNLSPNTGFLTTLAVPLWSIFAQIASLGAVGILIFLGSATMIGIEGFEYTKTIERGAKVAIYVFVSNFTYFGLAFAISLLDGFTKLIVFVFGGGSVFKLFEALIASVSSISKVGPGTSLIPSFEGIGQSIGAVFGQTGSAGDVTTTLVKEIIVVVGLGLIIWVFGRIFFMLLTRVAILLLLLITSPIWVLGILVKDSLPSELQGQVTKAVSLVSGTVLFNFAFITTLVLVTIITQKINGGISEFQKTIVANFEPATNTGLAFIDGVSANAQATSGVLSNDAFLGFGAGGFGDTISVCAVLGINLAIIYFAFDAIANLIDTNIQSVGKAVGGAVSKNLQNFRKAENWKQGIGMMGQDAFKYGKMAITGDNGLIADAGGAAAKGVSMGARKFNEVQRYYRDVDGVKTKAEEAKELARIPKAKFWQDMRNQPLVSLKNTVVDRLGFNNKSQRTNQDMIDDYNRKKQANGGKALTVEEENRQRERLELAKKFEEENAIKLGDEAQRNASPEAKLALQAARDLMTATKTEVNSAQLRLDATKEEIRNFQNRNGYSVNTPISEMTRAHQLEFNNLNNLKNQRELGLDGIKQQEAFDTNDYKERKKQIRGINRQNGMYNDDVAHVVNGKTVSKGNYSDYLVQSVSTNNVGIKNANKEGRRSFAGNIDQITNNAETIKKGIDNFAGSKSYKFKDEADFQENTAKQFEATQQSQNDTNDLLRELINRTPIPPPGP
jgi:hypothetical protein